MKIGILMGYSTLKGHSLAEEMSMFFSWNLEDLEEKQFKNWEMETDISWYNKYLSATH